MKDDDNFRLETLVHGGLANLKVVDLFVPGCRQWDVEMLHELFSPRDVDEIMTIPLWSVALADKCIWYFSKEREYTVRSGYKLVMERLVDSTHLHVPGEWRKFWRLKFPPKVRNFAWRLARGVVPNRHMLWARGMDVETSCCFCPHCMESSWHLFIGCSFPLECWRHAGIDSVVCK